MALNSRAAFNFSNGLPYQYYWYIIVQTSTYRAQNYILQAFEEKSYDIFKVKIKLKKLLGEELKIGEIIYPEVLHVDQKKTWQDKTKLTPSESWGESKGICMITTFLRVFNSMEWAGNPLTSSTQGLSRYVSVWRALQRRWHFLILWPI